MTHDDCRSRIAGWRSGAISSGEAEAIFESLPPLLPEALVGEWKGDTLPTRHPLDGLLEGLGWWGKRFRDVERVDPLLFERRGVLYAVDPRRLPSSLALHPPHLARRPAGRALFRMLTPLLATRDPRARLGMTCRAGVPSAAMIYDDLPVIDHFRAVDARTVMGLMDYRDMPSPFFFLLTRAAPTAT